MIKTNPNFIVNWEKKKLKKEFNIKDIEKKFNLIKKNYPNEVVSFNLINIYHLLIIFDYKHYLRDIQNFFYLFLNYIKIPFTNLFNEKKYNYSSLIIFCKHKHVDQINFSEVSNYLIKKNKKHLVVLNHKKNDFEKISKLYKNKNIINLRNFLNFSSAFKGIIKFFFYINMINKIITSLNCKKIRFQIYNLFFDFFMKCEMWENILNENKTKKIFLSYFSGDAALIYANRINKKKVEFTGYAFTGLDGNSPRYLFHNLDKLLVLGKVDTEILRKIKKYKFNFMSLPKKTLIVGSTRHDYFFKKMKIKKREKNSFKILYVKSNPFYLDGLEDKAFIQFSKIMNNFKNIEYFIQDRRNNISPSTHELIQKKIINLKNIEKSLTIEHSIMKADLCVGTNSTALLRQAINLNKPILQLYARKHYMWDTSKILESAYNEKKIRILIKKLCHNKNQYNKYLNLNKKMKSYILAHELKSNKLIYEILK